MYSKLRNGGLCKHKNAYVLIWRSTQVGRRGAPAKGVGRVTGAEVRIFSSPPRKTQIELVRFGFFLLLMNQAWSFCFVALPRIEFTNATKAIWMLAHKGLAATRCHRQRIFSSQHCSFFGASNGFP